MNYRVLLKVLGLLVLLVAGAMLICEIYAVIADRGREDVVHDWALLKSFAIAAALGLALLVAGRGAGDEILRKEGMAIVGLGWLISAVVGAIPYLLCTPHLDPAAAFFESASGFSTTGSSVISDLEALPALDPPLAGDDAVARWDGDPGALRGAAVDARGGE